MRRKQREKASRAKAKKQREKASSQSTGRSSSPHAESKGVPGDSASLSTGPHSAFQRPSSNDRTRRAPQKRSASLLVARRHPMPSPQRHMEPRRDNSLAEINTQCSLSINDTRPAMLATFDGHDGDGDGHLEPYELLAALSELLGRDVTAKSVAALFARTGVAPHPETVNTQPPLSGRVCARVRRALALAQYRRGATQPSASARVDSLAVELSDRSAAQPYPSAPPASRAPPAPPPLPPLPTTPAGARDGAPRPAGTAGGNDQAGGAPRVWSNSQCPAEFIDFNAPERTKHRFDFSEFNALHDHLILKPERIPLQTRCKHGMTRMYHPCEPLKIRWDSVLGAVLTYSLVVMFFRVCLNVPAEIFKTFWWIDLAVDFYFLVDMCFTFRTGIFENANAGVSGLKYIDNACTVAKECVAVL